MYQKGNKELRIISLYRGNYTSKFYLRQISSLTKLPLKTCQNTLLSLEKENIIKSKIEGKNKYFTLNSNNVLTKSYLLKTEIYNTEIFLEKYPLFITFLKSLSTNELIIIFGSFAKLKTNEHSDLDLFIVTNKKQKHPLHLLPYKVHQQILTENLFKKLILNKETLIKEIQENHIILNNHSSYVNIMWENYGK